MELKEFLRNTYKVEYGYQVRRPRVYCNDGYNISIQAGRYIYCTPRMNLKDGDYSTVELGFPSEADELINSYAEGDTFETSIYPYVPVEVVEELIKKHGGMK